MNTEARFAAWGRRRLEGRANQRIGRVLMGVAPWVNVALLIVMYLQLSAPYVLQPGVHVRLPESPFVAGARYGLNLVVLAGDATGGEIVFFDDQRYLIADAGQADTLRVALAGAARRKAGFPLVVEADEAVRHGTIIRLYDMAADAGVREINMATRPPR